MIMMRFTETYRSWPAGAIIAPNSHLSCSEIRVLTREGKLIPADQPWSPKANAKAAIETADRRTEEFEKRDVSVAPAVPASRPRGRPRKIGDVPADDAADKNVKEGDV